MQALKDRNPEVAASASSANICLAEETSGDDFDRRLNLVVEGVIDRHFGADRSLDGISRPDFVPYAEFKDVDDHED